LLTGRLYDLGLKPEANESSTGWPALCRSWQLMSACDRRALQTKLCQRRLSMKGTAVVTVALPSPLASSVAHSQNPPDTKDGSANRPEKPELCRKCRMVSACYPMEHSVAFHSPALGVQRKVARGRALYRAGDPLDNVYLILAGSAKVRLSDKCGREQIIDFPLPKNLFGFEGMENHIHSCDAVALEDSQVCAVSLRPLLRRCRQYEPAQRIMSELIAEGLERSHHLLLALGSMNSEERIVYFLLDMSKRMASIGYSSRQFNLRMTREDIGKHLGMTVETVSRTLSKLHGLKIVEVHHKHIEINNVSALQAMMLS